MAKYALLNNITHKDLKVIPRFSAEYGDNRGFAPTFPTEFADIQREYPILFRKASDTEKFEAVVILGFQKDENLFLDEDQNGNGWRASYIPAAIARGPFLIGFQKQVNNGVEEKEPVIHVDLDSPRLSKAEGISVFLEHGGNSPYLEYVSRILQSIHEGLAASEAMFAAFTKYDLLEPATVDIEINNGNKFQLAGFYTISAEKLSALSGDVLEDLNRSGFLQGAFLVLSSLHNLNRLIDIKNRKG